jgi:hypothetical protein
MGSEMRRLGTTDIDGSTVGLGSMVPYEFHGPPTPAEDAGSSSGESTL